MCQSQNRWYVKSHTKFISFMKFRAPHGPNQMTFTHLWCLTATSSDLLPHVVAYCIMWWPTATYSGLLPSTVA